MSSRQSPRNQEALPTREKERGEGEKRLSGRDKRKNWREEMSVDVINARRSVNSIQRRDPPEDPTEGCQVLKSEIFQNFHERNKEIGWAISVKIHID